MRAHRGRRPPLAAHRFAALSRKRQFRHAKLVEIAGRLIIIFSNARSLSLGSWRLPLMRALRLLVLVVLCFVAASQANAGYVENWSTWRAVAAGNNYNAFSVVLQGDQTANLSGLTANDLTT